MILEVYIQGEHHPYTVELPDWSAINQELINIQREGFRQESKIVPDLCVWYPFHQVRKVVIR